MIMEEFQEPEVNCGLLKTQNTMETIGKSLRM